MSSDYSRRSQSNRASLHVLPHTMDRVCDERLFRKMARARTAEDVLNALREIEEEKGIIICAVKLICGKRQRDFTFADAVTGNIHKCDVAVEIGETRILATMSSSASVPNWQEADDTALMAAYLIDRLDLQARLGVLPHLTGRAIAAPAIKGLRGESEYIKKLSEIVLRIIERDTLVSAYFG